MSIFAIRALPAGGRDGVEYEHEFIAGSPPFGNRVSSRPGTIDPRGRGLCHVLKLIFAITPNIIVAFLDLLFQIAQIVEIP